MKKAFIFIFALLITSMTFSQEITISPETQKCFVEQVIEVPDATADVLFTKAVEWISLNYNSAQDVIQYADNNKIILKGSFGTNLFMKKGWLKHTLVIEFKDGRFKYNYTDFVYYTIEGNHDYAYESKQLGFKKKIYAETEQNILACISSMTEYFNSEQVAKNDDW